MIDTDGIIFVVDDDARILASLQSLLLAVGCQASRLLCASAPASQSPSSFGHSYRPSSVSPG
jgi:FixJ family two-component response regulator